MTFLDTNQETQVERGNYTNKAFQTTESACKLMLLSSANDRQ